MAIKYFEFADHVLGFEITGDLSQDAINAVHQRLDLINEKNDYVSLYIEYRPENHTSLRSIIESFRYKLNHAELFYKIALVSDSSSFSLLQMAENRFLKAQVRYFKLTDHLMALNWVMEKHLKNFDCSFGVPSYSNTSISPIPQPSPREWSQFKIQLYPVLTRKKMSSINFRRKTMLN